MAIWAGLTLNTNVLSTVFNKIADQAAIPMIVKQNALLYHLVGKANPFASAEGNGVSRMESVTGNDHEWTLLGKVAAPDYITSASDELSTVTVGYDSAIVGNPTIILAHLGYTHGVPESEYLRFRGKELKTQEWMKTVMQYISFGYENVLGNALHSSTTTNVPALNKFGAWQAAVDDANTYAAVDRSDSGNADFRSIVNSSFGEVTLPKLQEQINTARGNMGRVSLGVAGTTLYTKIQSLVQPYSQVTYSSDRAEFGSEFVTFAGVKWIQDQRTTSGTIGIFDPQWWYLLKKDGQEMNTGGLIYDFTKKSGYVLPTTLWTQNACKKPNTQIKLSGCV